MNPTFGNLGMQGAQQSQVQYYNLNEIAQQSGNFQLCFQLDPLIDRMTPQVAMMVANEVQTQARTKGHPLRVNMFNYISENAFANQQFQDLVYVIMMRIGHGLQAREWQNPNQAAQVTVSNACKAYSGGLAVFNQEFLNSVAAEDPAAAQEAQNQAAIWQYLQALAQGQAPYRPFQTGPSLTSVPPSVQQNQAVGSPSGAFTEASIPKPLAANNNAGSAGESRYERMLSRMREEKAQQQTARETQAPTSVSGNNNGFGMRSYMQSVNAQTAVDAKARPVVQSAVGAQASQEFDKELEKVVEQKPLATLTLNGESVSLMRLLPDGKNWRRSRLQSHQPAYCKRTHAVRYFESASGEVIAVLSPLTPKQKEIAMNYDAHALDPTMGQPSTKVPTNPVREEAAVLYAAADKINVKVVIKPETSMGESFEGALKNASVLAARSSESFEAMVTGSIVNTAVIFKDKLIAEDQVHVINAAARAKTIKEAGEIISKLDDPFMQRMIEEGLTSDVNTVLSHELGLEDIRVSGGLKTYSDELEQVLEDNFGALIAEKFASRVPLLLKANLTVVPAREARDYADAVLTDGDQDSVPEELLERSVFLQRNLNICRLAFTDDELAVVVPEGRAAVLDGAATAALVEFARQMYSTDAPLPPALAPDNYVLTSDGVVYQLHRGLINSQSFLLSKA